ncbi:MAG: DNA internalization-related competence protein ComEC/Rec2 [Granulosicoccus sp.]
MLLGLAIAFVCLIWRCPWLRFSIAGIVMGLTTSLFHLQQIGSAQLDSDSISTDLRLRVRVVSVPDSNHNKLSFEARVLDCLTCSRRFGPERIQLSWYGADQMLQAGEIWSLTVRLKPLGSLRNPHGFDAIRWGFAKGLHARGYIRKNPVPVREQLASQLDLSALRATIAEHLEYWSSNERHIGLVQALTVGVKNNVSSGTWELLRNTGTAHLLAISGLHISLVAAWAFLLGGGLLNWLYKTTRFHSQMRLMPESRSVALALSVVVTFCYAMLSGFELPVQRAMMMMLVWVFASWYCRFLAPAGALALALIVVLLSNALNPLSVGFWLSFGTVWILFLLHRGRQVAQISDLMPWWDPKHRLLQVGSAFKTQIMLGLILLPIGAWFFQAGSVAAPLANLLAVPLVGLVIVPLCFVSLLLGVWLPAAATMVLSLIEKVIDGLLLALSFLSKLQSGAITLTLPDTAAFVLCLLGFICAFAPRGLYLRWLVVPLLMPALLFNVQRPSMSGFEVHALDVGQGLAVLVLSDNQTLLYDTGGRISKTLTMFEAVVMPYLHGLGRRRIDTLVVSHADSDHSAGVADVVRRFPDAKVYLSSPLDALTGTSASRCTAGQHWQDDDIHFGFIYPGASDSGSRNDLSCVLLIHQGRSRVLLPGDLEKKGESLLAERLASSSATFPVSLLLAPHHGSRTSSTEKLLRIVQPENVVFPAGRGNLYGFPHADVQLRYKLLGAKSYVTGIQGAVSFVFGPDGLRQPPDTWWQSNRRFWHGIVNPACSPQKGAQTHWLRLLWLAQKGQTQCGK